MMRIKKGDTVKMLSGKDRGKTGKVLSAMPSTERLVVEGLNMVKRNMRPRRQGEKGQTVSVPRSVPASNVLLMCPNCKNASRVGMRMDGTEKVRYCKRCEARI